MAGQAGLLAVQAERERGRETGARAQLAAAVVLLAQAHVLVQPVHAQLIQPELVALLLGQRRRQPVRLLQEVARVRAHVAALRLQVPVRLRVDVVVLVGVQLRQAPVLPPVGAVRAARAARHVRRQRHLRRRPHCIVQLILRHLSVLCQTKLKYGLERRGSRHFISTVAFEFIY